MNHLGDICDDIQFNSIYIIQIKTSSRRGSNRCRSSRIKFEPSISTLSAREPPMNEMILPSRHRIQHSIPDGLRPRTPSLGHGGFPRYWILRVSGEETFSFFKTRRSEWGSNRDLWLSKQAALTTAPGPPPEPPSPWKSIFLQWPQAHNIGIQMKQKALTFLIFFYFYDDFKLKKIL